MKSKRDNSAEKNSLHIRNKHKSRYDFDSLKTTLPELAEFVTVNKYGDNSIDFSDPKAVKTLNKALLKHHYQIDFDDIQ